MHSVLLGKQPVPSVSNPPSAINNPPSQWPVWARAIALFKSDTDAGVGDTVERIIGPANSTAYKAWFAKTFGRACGCDARQTAWNANFPYEKR